MLALELAVVGVRRERHHEGIEGCEAGRVEKGCAVEALYKILGDALATAGGLEQAAVVPVQGCYNFLEPRGDGCRKMVPHQQDLLLVGHVRVVRSPERV